MGTGGSSLDFFQAVFAWVVTAISQPPPAESMSPKNLIFLKKHAYIGLYYIILPLKGLIPFACEAEVY